MKFGKRNSEMEFQLRRMNRRCKQRRSAATCWQKLRTERRRNSKTFLHFKTFLQGWAEFPKPFCRYEPNFWTYYRISELFVTGMRCRIRGKHVQHEGMCALMLHWGCQKCMWQMWRRVQAARGSAPHVHRAHATCSTHHLQCLAYTHPSRNSSSPI